MKIKETRKLKNMTQKELADKIGVNYSVISRYENGTIAPSASRLAKIAEVLDVSVDYLLDNDASFEASSEKLSHLDITYADRYEIRDFGLMNRIMIYCKGCCELCGAKAPFYDRAGNPYLELHHVKWLSNGGLPILENSVALCPNCHKKIHMLNNPEDIQKISEAAKRHK